MLEEYNNLSLSKEEIDALYDLEAFIKEPLSIAGNAGHTRSAEVIIKNGHVIELNLVKKKILSLPESIGNFDYLKKLNLRDNKIISLPDSIEKLKRLKNLNLCWNRMILLPENIGQLKSLEKLNLSYNKISFLPDSIGSLSSLKELNLTYNQLKILPNTFGDLRSLQKLEIDDNKLESLPNSFIELNSIQEVSLDNNKLTYAYEKMLKQMENNGCRIIWQEDFVFEDRFRFFSDNIFLCAKYNPQTGKQKLIMEKVNLKTDKVELEDKIECIHTAVVDISFNEFEETIMDDRFEGKIINMISSENLPGIDLEPREKFRAFKSWVAGIAEAGTDAFRIQSDIDNAAKQMYPLAEKILKFMALADPYFIPEFLNKITRECVYEGVRHEACIIANITPLLEMVVFDPAKERHRDGDDWIFNEGDNLYYLEGYREILSAIFDSEFPLKLFTQNPKYIGFLRLPDAVKIPNFKEAFSHSNKNVRKSVALNSEAIYFDEFNKLLSYKTESSSEVRQAATRNPNGMKIYEKILEKSELPSEEIEALRELSIIIGKPLPKVDRFIWEDNYEKLKRNADQHVGVMIEDKHVRGLGLVFQDNDKLTYLPESIGNLKFLEYLALYRNSLVKIPKTIGNLKELKILTLGHNKLNSLPESIGQLKKLEKLCLNTNNLSVFPDCLTHLDSLRDLNLKKNQFNYLPESIGELKSLQILNLEKNQINTLPLSIGNFPQLEILRLGVNKLQTLPESIGQLSSLQEFILGANNLISLPESIGDLINLRKLCLNTNKLSVIPNSIKNLSNLKLINLYYNEFTQIPEVLNEIKTRGCKVILNIEDYNSFDFSNQGILDALDDYISYNTDDLAKKMKITNMADLRWLRSRLNFLAEKGLILLIEENGNNYWRIE